MSLALKKTEVNRRQKVGVLCAALDMEMKGQDQDDGDSPALRSERGK